jgi:hypothetical protein
MNNTTTPVLVAGDKGVEEGFANLPQDINSQHWRDFTNRLMVELTQQRERAGLSADAMQFQLLPPVPEKQMLLIRLTLPSQDSVIDFQTVVAMCMQASHGKLSWKLLHHSEPKRPYVVTYRSHHVQKLKPSGVQVALEFGFSYHWEDS